MISLSGPIVKTVGTAPTATAFYRLLFGGALLVPIALLRGQRLWPGRRAALLALVCALAFALDMTMWNRSIRLVGPGLATILVSCQVFFMALYGVVIAREPFGLRLGLALPLAVLGLFLIVGPVWQAANRNYRLGIVLGLTTALCYATYLIALRRLQRVTGPGATLGNIARISVLGALLLGLFSVLLRENLTIPAVRDWGLLVGYGIIGQVLAWVLISRALPHVRAPVAGLILLMQPLLSAVWDVLLFRRPVTLLEGLGALATLAAIYLGLTAARPAQS